MPNELKVEIGNLCSLIRVEENSNFLNTLRNEYREFISAGAPDITVNVKPNGTTFADAELKRVGMEGVATRWEQGLPLRVIFKKGIAIIKRNDMEGKIDIRNNRAVVKISKNFLSFDSFLRIFYSLVMVERDGFLVHAAGIAKKDGGYIFAGPESSGKTTVAKRFPASRVASDEIIIIRKKKGRFLLYGTPFIGEIKEGKNIEVEAKELFILSRGENTRKLTPYEATAELLRSVILFTNDIEMNKKVLELVCYFCKSVPCEKLNIFQ